MNIMGFGNPSKSGLPPWLESVIFQHEPTFGGGPNPDGSMSLADKTGAPPARSPGTGFLSGLGDRAALAQAFLSGDMSQVAAVQARQQETEMQRQALALRQQAAQQEIEAQNNQVWGMKDSGQFSNQEIAAMNPADRSQSMRELVNPYTLSPGQERHTRGVGGAPEQVVTAPTTEQQQADFYESIMPGARAAFVNQRAYGPPIPIQQGGGVVGNGPEGWHYVVQPDGVAPQTAPGAPPPPAGGGAARNNPGGLRYSGSTRFRTFPTEAAGIAAQEQLLGRPQYLGTPHSVAQIVERYAPRRSRGGDNTDEQVNNYIAYVSRRLGVDPTQPLTAADVPRVAAAMREVETGRRPGPNAPRLSAAPQQGPGISRVGVTSGGPAGAPRLPVAVSSPADAARLPRGTVFRTPDGQVRTRS